MVARSKKDYNRPNFWGMIQNIFIGSMNKGQLLPAVLGLGFIIYILKIPSRSVVSVGEDFGKALRDTFILGWFLLFVSVAGWYWHTKRMRKKHTEEIKRISDEKTRLQQRLNKSKKLKTSNKR